MNEEKPKDNIYGKAFVEGVTNDEISPTLAWKTFESLYSNGNKHVSIFPPLMLPLGRIISRTSFLKPTPNRDDPLPPHPPAAPKATKEIAPPPPPPPTHEPKPSPTSEAPTQPGPPPLPLPTPQGFKPWAPPSPPLKLNEEMIETLFGYAPLDKCTNDGKGPTSLNSAPTFVQIVNSKKPQNITIEEVCAALHEDVKGTDEKTTLLQFVVQEMVRLEGIRVVHLAREHQTLSCVKLEDLLQDAGYASKEYYQGLGLQVVSGLGSELENVNKAATINADALTESVAKLNHALIKSRNFLNTNMNSIEESGFH
ncbi:hypothetical protein SAY86_003804 [Trapa natans]|uniref:FH2 domain-containing protein n=1 Tax=Trapa natans TaxID=22666 RepID=A0AAN7RHC9_TRANT|nr:hypothetical protein SAY86_003804 [Trapa natans]